MTRAECVIISNSQAINPLERFQIVPLARDLGVSVRCRLRGTNADVVEASTSSILRARGLVRTSETPREDDSS